MSSTVPTSIDAIRRDSKIAFGVLFGILVSHSLLETARDTLFLTSLPANRLPLVYLAIAILTLCVAIGQRRYLLHVERRFYLASVLFVTSLITGGFWFWAGPNSPASLYCFYIWTGMVVTVSTGIFWLLQSSKYSVTEAKRVFAYIGAGGLSGATVGSILSGVLLHWFSARELMLVAAATLLLTAIFTFLLSASDTRAGKSSQNESLGIKVFFRHPYTRQLIRLVLVTSFTITFADLLFKTVISERIQPENLGTFFAIFYSALNATALIVQLFFASRLIRSMGINQVLWLLPALLLINAFAFAVTLTLLPVLLFKVCDGTLRHSLNRTATELLYVPLKRVLREPAKVFIDGVSSRAGQGLASVFALLIMTLGAGTFQLSLVLIVLSGAWIFTVIRFRKPYLELFREHLRDNAIQTTLDVPQFDQESVEMLIQSLNSSDERVVQNSLQILVQAEKTHLIPNTMLLHPSPKIALKSLNILAKSNREDFLKMCEILLQSPEAPIRATALRAYTAIKPNEPFLRRGLEDPNPIVKTNALVGLIASGFIKDEDTNELVLSITQDNEKNEVELLRSLTYYKPANLDKFCSIISVLAAKDSTAVNTKIATLAKLYPHPRFTKQLIAMLKYRKCRSEAREALVAIGDSALQELGDSLGIRAIPLGVRRHIPKTISHFNSQAALDVLMDFFNAQPHGVVAYKILRGLRLMTLDNPDLKISETSLRAIISLDINQAVTTLDWRLELLRHRELNPELETRCFKLLVHLFQEKRTSAVERLFLLYGLIFPTENWEQIYSGLRSENRRSQASSRELLESMLHEPTRTHVLALADQISDNDSYNALASDFQLQHHDFNFVLTEISVHGGDTARILAAGIIAELGIVSLKSVVEAAVVKSRGLVCTAIVEQLDILSTKTEAA